MSKSKAASAHQPNWLIASKMAPPQSSAKTVDRRALTATLDAALRARLVLVLAAAGYGKTTALALWRDKLVAKGVAVAWLSLDEDDREAAKLVRYLVRSLASAGIALGELLAFVSSDRVNLQPRASILGLVQVLGAFGRDAVIILDDYHCAQSKENDELLDLFVRRLPGNVHLVVASRDVPRFDWIELRSRGELVQLGVADLQFEVAEARALIGAALPTSQIEDLVRTTEGWAMGLQLATIHLKKYSAGVANLADFSGRAMEVTDYLLEQVFCHQPADVQEFLLRTSVLDRFSGDLANAVSERDDAWEVIERLHKQNLFLVFLDPERHWCRYHHLFAEFLQERLRRAGGDSSARVHEKAAEWFDRKGLVTEAVKHALQSGSLERVAQIVERAGGWRLGVTGHLPILRKTCSRLPEGVMRRYPRLWLGDILLSAKSGRLDDAERKLRELQWVGTEADAGGDLARAERMVIDILIAGYRDRLVTSIDLEEIERHVRRPSFDDDLVLALLNNYLCLVYLDAGKFKPAIDAGRRCREFFARRDDAYSAKVIDTHIGQALLAQGRLAEATAIYEQIHEYARTYPGDGGDVAAIAGVLLAETAYERNDLARAEQHLQASLPHIEKCDGWFDIYASGYATAAALAHATQGIAASMAILDRAEEIAYRRSLDRLGRLVRLCRVRELTRAGDLQTAATFAEEFEPFETAEQPRGSELPNWRLLETAALSLAELSLERGDQQRAMAMLSRHLADAESRGWTLSSIKLQIKLALCHKARGAEKDAFATIEQALLKAASQGFIRSFVVEGEPARGLLSALLERDQPLIPALRDFVTRILADRTLAAAMFGDQQKEVLDLLVKGCSTKEIAARLGVSPNTVKYHRKRLFEKLGARSRSQAIAAARNLAL